MTASGVACRGSGGLRSRPGVCYWARWPRGRGFRDIPGTVPLRAVRRRVPGASRGVRSGGSCAGRDEDRVERLLRAGRIVTVGLGHVAEASAAAHDGDRGVRQAGEAARQMAHAGPAAVLVVGEIADVAHTVLYGPMVAHQVQKLLGSGAFGAERGRPRNSLAAASAETLRLRLGLRAAWERTLASGATLSPRIEVGLRRDGGDAETGAGLETGGGVRYADPARGLSASLDARALALHGDADIKDRGLALEAAWDPRPGASLGPAVTAARSWGGPATGGVDALLGPDVLPGLRDGGAGRIGLEASWGTAPQGMPRGTAGSAYTRVSGAPGAEEVRIGWRVAPDGAPGGGRRSRASVSG